MKKIFLILITLFASNYLFAQQQQAQLGFCFGTGTFTNNASYNINWGVALKNKFFIGTGVRYTGFYGKNINYTSAPATLAGDKLKEDTLFAPKPSSHSINLLINLGYKINDNVSVGFDIDALGFTIGSKGTPTYIRNGVGTTVASAKPTSGNILLIGNNDKGQLNSNIYVQSFFGKQHKYGVRLAFQYLFAEVTTSTKVQTIPEVNDRFRYKATGINITGIIKL